MAKFKVGDTLTRKRDFQGFEEITIKSIDSKWYHCTIPRGITNVPIHIMDAHYELL